MTIKPTIHAQELAQDDITNLKTYYKLAKLKGTIKQVDLLTNQTFPKTDVCFLFKLVDVLEHQQRKTIHTLLKNIKSKWIVVSFATKTLGGKPMKTSRQWFINLLKHGEYKHSVFRTNNEIFFIIKNS